MMEKNRAKGNGEESIRYFFLMAINAMPMCGKPWSPITARRLNAFCGSRYTVFSKGLWKKISCTGAAASRS